MKIESFEIDDQSNKYNLKIFERYSVESFKEYNLAKNGLDEEERNFRGLKKTFKNKINLHFLVFILILTAILFLCTLIYFIIVLSKYEQNYKKEENIYLKPSSSEHNYSRLIFDNGLEIVLIQIHTDDMAGGSITFDSGYLDPKYKPGFLRLALDSLKFNDINNYENISEYMPYITHNSEEFY